MAQPATSTRSSTRLGREPADASSQSVAKAGPARESRVRGLEDWYRAGDVVQIVQISRRQLQYWAQTDLIAPSAKTPGGHGRYTFEDLVALKATKRLIDAGVSVQRIRESIRALRQMLPTVEKPLAELVLVATGDVVLAFKDGTAFDAISGQEWVFEVAQFQREIEAWRRGNAPLPMTAPQPPERAPSEQEPRA
jgi:DNA-binding transcriptional MerR regulator